MVICKIIFDPVYQYESGQNVKQKITVFYVIGFLANFYGASLDRGRDPSERPVENKRFLHEIEG